MAAKRMKYFWSDLPKELLVLIVERLDDDHIEINKFRAVCRSWRFSIPHPPLYSIPLSTFYRQIPEMYRDYYYRRLSETTIYHLQDSTTGERWVCRIRIRESGKFEMTDPFGRSLDHLGFPNEEKVINLLKFRFSKITKLYHLRGVSHNIWFSPSSVNNYPILALQGDIQGYDDWHRVKNYIYKNTIKKFYDCNMVDHKRKLYKFDSETDTVFVNEYSLQLRSEIKAPVSGVFDDPSASLTCCKTFWISFGNDLFFVKKVNLDDSKKIIIRVYKLDEEEQIFVPVTSLGNKALFLCCDHSFGVDVPQEFNKIGEGLIYFLEVDPPSPHERNPWFFGFGKKYKPWVFSLEKNTFWELPNGQF